MKYWLSLFSVLILAGLGAWLFHLHLNRDALLEVQFEQVQVGMTEEQVIDLLGKPDETSVHTNNGPYGLFWESDKRRFYYCVIIENGLVRKKNIKMDIDNR